MRVVVYVIFPNVHGRPTRIRKRTECGSDQHICHTIRPLRCRMASVEACVHMTGCVRVIFTNASLRWIQNAGDCRPLCSSQELGKPSCYANYSGLQSGIQNIERLLFCWCTRISTTYFVDRGFAAAGPRLWNGLPSHHALQWHRTVGLSSRVVSASDCGVRRSRFESHRWQLCLSRRLLRYVQSWARAVHLYCSA